MTTWTLLHDIATLAQHAPIPDVADVDIASAVPEAGATAAPRTWWEISRTLIADIFVVIGVVFCFLSSVGIVRMPDVYTRMQAATKAGTLGVSCIVLALAVYESELKIVTEAILVVLFFFLTAPVATHLLARAAYFDDDHIWDQTQRDDLLGCYDLKSGRLLSSPVGGQPRISKPKAHRAFFQPRRPHGRAATEDEIPSSDDPR